MATRGMRESRRPSMRLPTRVYCSMASVSLPKVTTKAPDSAGGGAEAVVWQPAKPIRVATEARRSVDILKALQVTRHSIPTRNPAEAAGPSLAPRTADFILSQEIQTDGKSEKAAAGSAGTRRRPTWCEDAPALRRAAPGRRPKGETDGRQADRGTPSPASGSPAARRSREEQRESEERRVGKECRSRWSPYH